MRPRLLPFTLVALLGCTPPAEPVSPQPPPPAEHAEADLAAPVLAEDPSSAARIAADIGYLASPELAGRGTGKEGARLARDHVAKRFAELKLAPLGTDGFLQSFMARVGAKVSPASIVRGPGKGKPVGVAVETAEGSSSGEAKGSAVFVGFGISAAAAHWDDYAGESLEGKIAVVLAGSPDGEEATAKALKGFGSDRYKIRTAREHKAAGVILVARKDEGIAGVLDPQGMGLPAVVVGPTAARKLFPSPKLENAAARSGKAMTKPVALPGGALTLTTKVEAREAEAWNVIGKLPGKAGSAHAGEVVIVGAHYDHLGEGDARFSLAPDSHAAHLGADDNASGTALMLEVARRLAPSAGQLDRDVVFMGFGAEELGTLGSRFFVEHPTVPLSGVTAMINADMVGRLRNDRLMIDGVGTAEAWKGLLDGANQGIGLTLVQGAEGFGASDHASFAAARVPVSFLFTGAHADYHKPSDTADKINSAGEARIALFAARLTLAVVEAKERMAFVEVKSDPHGGGGRGGFKVALGTMPDYAYTGKGVRLEGLRPDSPAARAGLQRGDVIVKLGGHEIGNLHDYMFALGELEAGRETTVVAQRGSDVVTLKIIPAPGR